MNLGDVLKSPGFSDFFVIAGRGGIERKISTVSVMDAPDIYKWMKGGEFLITSGYPLMDCPEYASFLIEKLDKHGASALGIKFGRFIDEIPKEALELADRLNFPIVSIPYPIAFTDVINPVLREVINSQSKKLLYTENLHKHFTQMAFGDVEMPLILTELENNIHADVFWVDTYFDEVIFSSRLLEENQKFCNDVESIFCGNKGRDTLLEKFEHYRIYSHDNEYGYLMFGNKGANYEESFAEYYQIAIEQAGLVLIFKEQKKIAEKQVESNYRDHFVQDLLTGNISSEKEIRNRAAIYGWDFSSGGIVVLLDIDHYKKQYTDRMDVIQHKKMNATVYQILKICTEVLERDCFEYVYSKLSDQIVFIVMENKYHADKLEQSLKKTFNEIKLRIRERTHFTATIGVSGFQREIRRINENWNEARKAVKISRNIGQNDTIAFYHELGAYRLLSVLNKSEEAKLFQNQYLLKLKEYDKLHGSELLETLLVLVGCGWNLKETSEKLFVHYNSMKYRYRKICSVTGLDLQDQEQRLNIMLALKLYQINKDLESEEWI